jgi:hypothetical protein
VKPGFAAKVVFRMLQQSEIGHPSLRRVVRAQYAQLVVSEVL